MAPWIVVLSCRLKRDSEFEAWQKPHVVLQRGNIGQFDLFRWSTLQLNYISAYFYFYWPMAGSQTCFLCITSLNWYHFQESVSPRNSVLYILILLFIQWPCLWISTQNILTLVLVFFNMKIIFEIEGFYVSAATKIGGQ